MLKPSTFLVGATDPCVTGISDYLDQTGQHEFYEQFRAAVGAGVPRGMALCSMYAKLCYKSLVLGKNDNISKIRDIEQNIEGCFDSGHGSVFEHCWLNFITTNCSRVFTHELVRHRVGTAFSQTSGRYCAIDDQLRIVYGEDLEPVSDIIKEVESFIISKAKEMQDRLIPENADFATKKRLTSAIRRIAPNGQSNEIGWSCNVRSLRHMIEMRTSRHAEWEIRLVFNQVADIICENWPLMLYGHKRETVDGMYEYTKLRV